MSELKVNGPELQILFRSKDGPVYRELLRVTNGVLRASRAVNNVPVRKGRLKASMAMEIRTESSGLVGVVGSNTEYAVYVHEGTRPHRIAAKNGKSLKFEYLGRTVFPRWVNHPGSKGNPWLIRALEMNGLVPRRTGR